MSPALDIARSHNQEEEESSIEVEDVEETVRGLFEHGSAMDLKVNLTKRQFRATR